MKTISDELGISLSTLRYYEQKGIEIGHRQENGYRIFNEEDKIKLKYLLVMKYAGFTIEEIKELLQYLVSSESQECSERSERLLTEKEREIEEKIRHEQMILELIQELKPKVISSNYKKYEEEINQRIISIYENMKQTERSQK